MNAIRQHGRFAWMWLVVVLAALLYNGKVWFVDHRPLETDFLALLPADESDPVVRYAFNRVANAAEQNVLILVGSTDWQQARAAGEAYAKVLATHADWFTPASLAAMESDSAIAPWWASRRNLVSTDDRRALTTNSADEWVSTAMNDLLSPMGSGRVGAWQDDPFGFFRRWLQARAAETPVRPVDGVLRVDDDSLHFVVLPMQLRAQAFALQAQREVIPLLNEAKLAAEQLGSGVTVRSSGMIFPAAAAAQQASHELSTIGWGSIAGIILITWVTFRSLRPIGLILLSLGVGTLGALAVTAFFYESVHLLTLVFGASLIGVAEDYGMHYLCVSDRAARGGVAVVRELLPSLSLALLTKVVSFIGMGASPFPGLQQIALFSAVGLVFAWVTVIVWFPTLDGRQPGRARVVAWFNKLRLMWMRLSQGSGRVVLGVATAAISALGISRLHANDDIRLLQSLPEGLIQEQTDVGRILGVPFAAQLYVVRGPSSEVVLQREERLRVRLDSLVQRRALTGYQSVSSWVPSLAQQQRDAALVKDRILSPTGALRGLRVALDEDSAWETALRDAGAEAGSLTIERWLTSSLSEPLRMLWIGKVGEEVVSVVTLKGVANEYIPALASAATGLEGVIWGDKVAGISSVLGRYRVRMSWVLMFSYGMVWLIFLPRFGRAAWRILAPSVCASVVSLAVIGLSGQPLQLFHVLALYLVFGLGVDYAIFLSDQTPESEHDVSFAVGLAAVSTVLSLGLLALSATPVLHAFGLIMLVGITVSLLAAPLFCAGTSMRRRASSLHQAEGRL
ncbi:MAG: MMPL family transporter [Phycisphaerae bacterium]|nr:MMPL family transporter [Gemmatimonadaceae bacterium]